MAVADVLAASTPLDEPLPPNTCGNRARRRRAIAEQQHFLEKLNKRPFVRTASQFTANSGREAAAQCFELGFSNVLPGEIQANANAPCTKGLGGDGGKKYFQLSASLVNLNASMRPPDAVYRTPSVFDCNSAECQATLCYEQGWAAALPSVQQSQKYQNCTLGLNGVSKTYGNLCPRVRRFGSSSA